MSDSTIRLLAVDDVAMNLTVLSELLSTAGYTVDCALTAREGLALAREHHYPLMLLDIQLPDFNGDVLLQRLRADTCAKSNASPAFALTGELNVPLKVQLLRSGFADVFAKPYAAASLLSAIRQIVGVTVPSAIQTDASDALFDRAQALKTTGGDEKLMLKLRTMLVAELLNKGAGLRRAYAQNDALALNELRHKLAGAAGFTGAHALVAALAQLKAQPSEHAIAAVECEIFAIIHASKACDAPASTHNSQ